MPKTYSDDLRCKLLEAYAAGRGSLRDLAEQFGVSWGFSKKIRGQQLRTGQKERPIQRRHGPVSCVTEQVKQQLRTEVLQQPDRTLVELRQRIYDKNGVWLSKSLVWLWLKRLGLRYKKNSARAGTRQRRKLMAASSVVGVGQQSGSCLSVFSGRRRCPH